MWPCGKWWGAYCGGVSRAPDKMRLHFLVSGRNSIDCLAIFERFHTVHCQRAPTDRWGERWLSFVLAGAAGGEIRIDKVNTNYNYKKSTNKYSYKQEFIR
jgi:hypothetical protein